MAELLTWQQKVEQGLPLNHLEQVKADAWYVATRRERDQKDEAARAEERAKAMSTKNVKEALAASQPKETPKSSK